jgi:hypothetical protein
MKRHLALLILALACVLSTGVVHAQDDQYIRVYTLIQEAENLEERNENAQALARFLEAQTALTAFQKGNPNWNIEVVKFRATFLESRIAALRDKGVTLPAASRPAAPRAQTPSLPPAIDSQAEINRLNDQNKQLHSDNSLLQAKLREALTAVPARPTPRKLNVSKARLGPCRKPTISHVQVGAGQSQARCR